MRLMNTRLLHAVHFPIVSLHLSHSLPPLISSSASGRGAVPTLAPNGAKTWLLLATWSWCDPCASPKRSSGIPANSIIFLLMTPQPAAALSNCGDDGFK